MLEDCDQRFRGIFGVVKNSIMIHTYINPIISVLIISIVCFTELVTLQEPRKVATCQEKVAEPLYYRMRVTRPNEPYAFLGCISAITELRSLPYHCTEAIKHFTELSDLPLPQLLVDMWMS